jgi:SpoVK/Ycf46/Vps4 family AAA+-type ATPase
MGDTLAFRSAAESLITEEDRKGHRLLARDLKRMLDPNPGFAPMMPGPRRTVEVPEDEERGLPLAEVEHPSFGLERIVVNEGIRTTLRILVEDYQSREIFASFGLESKQRVLFFGPPGCGKTITARALAGELGLPMLYVRFDSLVSSYLGQTAANLRKLFDFVRTSRWVILFDEFDAVGRSRDDPNEHGELKRVINSILQMMDGLRTESLLIAATNHEHALDPALWRRFDEIARFGPPDEHQRLEMLRKFLGGFEHHEPDLRVVAADTRGLTGSDLERVVVEAVKQCVLGRKTVVELDDLLFGLKRQRERLSLAELPSPGQP